MSASEASALFDVVGEGAPVGLALVDTELRFVRINSALCAINGRPRELHIGRRLDEVLPEMASVLVPIYQHVIESGEPVLERELTAEQPGTGHVRHVLASWFPVRIDGEVTGVGAVVIDVTDLKAAEMRLEGVLRQLPVGVVIADAAGRVLLTNQRLGEMGMTVAPSGTHLAEAEFAAWHADGRPYAREEWPLARSLMRGEIVRGEEMEFAGSDGGRRVLEANSAPIRDGMGTIVAAVVVVQDVTARRQATQRQDLLVRAGEVLDSALGVDERLDRFARLLVPQLADFVKIELLEGKSGRRPVAIAHQDPAREALMRAWRDRGTLAASERVGMGTTMATGEAKLTTEIVPEAVVRSALETTGEEGAELMRAIGPRSQIVVPLRARGRVLGALSLTMAESGRHYDEADLDLARDLGLRAGLAVDNARLYEEAQASAVAEQRRAEMLDALAAASLAIHRTRSVERRLQLIAERARELIGARFAHAIVQPGRADELGARAGEAVAGEERLSAPLIARDGSEIGRIDVAGKVDGEFAPADEHAARGPGPHRVAGDRERAAGGARAAHRAHAAGQPAPARAAGDRRARGGRPLPGRRRGHHGGRRPLRPLPGRGRVGARGRRRVRQGRRGGGPDRHGALHAAGRVGPPLEPVRRAAAAQRRDHPPARRRPLLHRPARARHRRRRPGPAGAGQRRPPAAARAARRRAGRDGARAAGRCSASCPPSCTPT